MTDLKNAEQVYRLAMKSVFGKAAVSNSLSEEVKEFKRPSAYVRRCFPFIAAAVLAVFVSVSAIALGSAIKARPADSVSAPSSSTDEVIQIKEADTAYSSAEESIQLLLRWYDSLLEPDKSSCEKDFLEQYESLRAVQAERIKELRRSGGEEYTLLDASLDDQGILRLEVFSPANAAIGACDNCICYTSGGSIQMSFELPGYSSSAVDDSIITLFIRPKETTDELSGDVELVLSRDGKYPDDTSVSWVFKLSIDTQNRYLNREKHNEMLSEVNMLKQKLIPVLSSLMLLTACNEAPDDVKSRAEEQNGSSGDTVAVGEGETIRNITFSCEPDKTETDEFYILRSQPYPIDTDLSPELPKENYAEQIDRLKAASKELLGFELSDDRILVHGRLGEEKPETASRNGTTIEYVGYNDPDYYSENPILAELYGESDTFDLYDFRGTDDGTWPNMYLEREVYYPEEYPDTSYEMLDGSEMTIADAVSQGDEIIEKIYSLELLDSSVGLRLSKIAVHRTDAGKDVINLRYRQIRSGLPLNDDGYMTLTSLSDKQLKYTYFDISFMGSDHPMMIRNMNSSRIESTEKVDKLMSYEDAQQRLAAGLAENMTFTVTEAGLRYCGLYSQTDKYDEYHPMWVFVLKDPTLEEEELLTPEDMGNLEKVDSFQYYKRTMGFVDALNGDLYYYDPKNGTLSKDAYNE